MVWTSIWRLIGFGRRPSLTRTTARDLFGDGRPDSPGQPVTTDILEAYLAPRRGEVIDLARWRAVRG